MNIKIGNKVYCDIFDDGGLSCPSGDYTHSKRVYREDYYSLDKMYLRKKDNPKKPNSDDDLMDNLLSDLLMDGTEPECVSQSHINSDYYISLIDDILHEFGDKSHELFDVCGIFNFNNTTILKYQSECDDFFKDVSIVSIKAKNISYDRYKKLKCNYAFVLNSSSVIRGWYNYFGYVKTNGIEETVLHDLDYVISLTQKSRFGGHDYLKQYRVLGRYMEIDCYKNGIRNKLSVFVYPKVWVNLGHNMNKMISTKESEIIDFVGKYTKVDVNLIKGFGYGYS